MFSLHLRSAVLFENWQEVVSLYADVPSPSSPPFLVLKVSNVLILRQGGKQEISEIRKSAWLPLHILGLSSLSPCSQLHHFFSGKSGNK